MQVAEIVTPSELDECLRCCRQRSINDGIFQMCLSSTSLGCRVWRLGLVRRNSHRLDLQSFVHIESLFAIQTLHKLSRRLSNRSSNTRRFDFDSAACSASVAIFIIEFHVVRFHLSVPPGNASCLDLTLMAKEFLSPQKSNQHCATDGRR